MVDHKLFCKQIEFLGIRGVACKWLTSYLANRKNINFVSIDTCKSDVRSVPCGMPQGSILGPMCNISKLVKYILFADDTKTFYVDSDIGKLSDNMCNILDKMSTWIAVNRLILNISKTNYMQFGKRMLSRDVVIQIRTVNIERVRFVKFLGVYVDDLLNWNYHIIYVKSKLSKSVGITYRCSHMHIIYWSLFLPYLTYCVEIKREYISNKY